MYRKDRKEEYFTRKAKEEGYPARSIYKLKEIDEEFDIIKKGDVVLDLGAAPGSWLLYLSQKAKKVVGVDMEDIKIPERSNIVFHKKNIEDEDIFDIIKDEQFDAVVADVAPKTTGIKMLDSGASLDLVERIFEIVRIVLKENGNFICKIFEGKEAEDFLKKISSHFKLLKRLRPRAVIRRSKEFYIVAKGFKK